MKIQCPKCSVRFKLPDGQAGPGQKFRCGVCKHVFTAEEAEQSPEAVDHVQAQTDEEPAQSTPASAASPTASGAKAAAEDDFLDDLLAEDDSSPAPENADTDNLDALLIEQTDADKPTEATGDALEDLFKEDADAAESEGAGDSNEPAAVSDFDQFLQDNQQADSEVAADEEIAGSVEEPELYEKPDTAGALDDAAASQAKPRKMKLILRMISLIILLIIIIGVGLYLYGPEYLTFNKGADKSEQSNATVPADTAKPTNQTMTGNQTAQPAQTPQPLGLTLIDMRQYRIQGKAGPFDVVEGAVKNVSNAPKSLVRLEASLYNASGQPMYRKKFYAGPYISSKDLENWSMEEIDAYLNDKKIISENNSYIEPGTAVKFTAVFPVNEKIVEYGIEIISAKDLLPENTLKN